MCEHLRQKNSWRSPSPESNISESSPAVPLLGLPDLRDELVMRLPSLTPPGTVDRRLWAPGGPNSRRFRLARGCRQNRLDELSHPVEVSDKPLHLRRPGLQRWRPRDIPVFLRLLEGSLRSLIVLRQRYLQSAP